MRKAEPAPGHQVHLEGAPRLDSSQPGRGESGVAGDLPAAPAGVVVDAQMAVLEFIGNTSRYLQLPMGKARLNLRLMLRPGLQHPVLEALREVRQGAKSSSRSRLALKDGAGVWRVNVEVSPIDRHPSGKLAFRVLFEEASPRTDQGRLLLGAEPQATAEKQERDARIERLKRELLSTRATLESIIEEQEIGTARFKSAYYELETANAELEATNEELATVNAELAAVNEELRTTIEERDQAEQERQRLEAEIVRAQRLESLRVMAGGVAHDFNNLLTSIGGNAGLLLEELSPGSEAWNAVEQIEKAAQHAAALVKQMLAFCGKGSLTVEPVDISALIRDSLDLVRASISKTVELRCDLAGDLPSIEADPTQLRQVLINLVVNASEAIGGVAGVITVCTRYIEAGAEPQSEDFTHDPLPPGPNVCLEVADTGAGMDEETKARIFEPFYSTKFAGRGLGMAAVLGIVRGHQGSIVVNSRPAQGTGIRVLFPASPQWVPATEVHPAPAAGWRGTGTVLVVDDEEAVRNVAKAILGRAGLQVMTAADGRQALDMLRRQGALVDAVLLDMVMPRMSGEEVLQQLRSFSPEMPVILSSGYSEETETASRLSGYGSTVFLAKPYRPADLIEKVREAMATQPHASLNGHHQ